MSSAPFATELRPDSLTRLLVLVSGLALQVTGLVIWLNLSLMPVMKVSLFAGLVWLLQQDWRRQLGGYRRVARIRIYPKGNIECIDADGRRQGVRLLGGSFVLPKLAWLRLELPDRLRYGELLLACCCGPDEWHWLQLTARQQGPRFGQPERS